MSAPPAVSLSGVNIGAPDPSALAHFYEQLLGWEVRTDEPGWVVLRNPQGGVTLAFQEEERFEPPVWPADGEHQQMMMHLEVRVDDLDASVAHAVNCGATVAEFQPQDHVRVCLDPAGHPFCLWLG